MRYMRWSYADLLVCPEGYLTAIVEESKREAQQTKAARQQNAPPRRPRRA